MSFKLVGVEAIVGKLRKNVTLTEVKQAVATNGAEMTRNAQRLAPVDTGILKGSINLSIEDGGMTSVTRDGVNYGKYLDLGTRFMSAQPFMTPAHNLQAKKFKRDMEMLVK